jgi:hypothetical protein
MGRTGLRKLTFLVRKNSNSSAKDFTSGPVGQSYPPSPSSAPSLRNNDDRGAASPPHVNSPHTPSRNTSRQRWREGASEEEQEEEEEEEDEEEEEEEDEEDAGEEWGLRKERDELQGQVESLLVVDTAQRELLRRLLAQLARSFPEEHAGARGSERGGAGGGEDSNGAAGDEDSCESSEGGSAKEATTNANGRGVRTSSSGGGTSTDDAVGDLRRLMDNSEEASLVVQLRHENTVLRQKLAAARHSNPSSASWSGDGGGGERPSVTPSRLASYRRDSDEEVAVAKRDKPKGSPSTKRISSMLAESPRSRASSDGAEVGADLLGGGTGESAAGTRGRTMSDAEGAKSKKRIKRSRTMSFLSRSSKSVSSQILNSPTAETDAEPPSDLGKKERRFSRSLKRREAETEQDIITPDDHKLGVQKGALFKPRR